MAPKLSPQRRENVSKFRLQAYQPEFPHSPDSVCSQMKSHYDVLELEKNCTPEEIKDSYLRLSKKYHPDVNSSSDAHKKFVQVNEAYSVLGKAKSKQEYDEILSGIHESAGIQSSRRNVDHVTYAEYMRRMNRVKHYQQGAESQAFPFKIKGIVFCCLLMLIGTSLHFKHAWSMKNSRNSQSQETSLLLAQARSRAHQLGYQQAVLNFANGNLTGHKVKDPEEDIREE